MKLFHKTIATSRVVMAIPCASHNQGCPNVVRDNTMGMASSRSKRKRTMVICAWKRTGSLALKVGGREGGREGRVRYIRCDDGD
jgi:hypothetical protein